MTTGSYTAQDITVLEGLEAVRRRPGMYIGGTGKDGLHHLLWEIVDNAMDEAINGHASTIEVMLHADGTTVEVSDNGRGIPVDIHPKEGRSALELILTTLHAGGKFDQNNYKTAGGLHGVGSSVVNALSEEFVATIRRDASTWQQRYVRGAPQAPVERIGDGQGTGTSIRFRPDGQIMETTVFDAEVIRERLQVKAFLTRGVRIVFRDRVGGTYHEFKHTGGVVDFLAFILDEEDMDAVHDQPFTLDVDAEVRMELALQWTEGTQESLRSFVNGIPTRDGGTHEGGLRDGVIKAVRSYIDAHDLLPKSVSITSEDIREGLVGVLSLYMSDPQFQGQTKGRLNNPEVRSVVSSQVKVALEQFLHTHHNTIGQQVVARIIQAAKARKASRAAVAQVVQRKRPVSRRLNLPGKLADCASSDPADSELFIVEGDSAGGSAKQGRHRETQAILPLRGKVLNAEQATASKVMQNKELQDIVSALGCGLGTSFNIENLRYHKIILLMDADSDGHHIATLLLTFFYRYLPELIRRGHVFLAQPPLYKVTVGQETRWALTDRQRDQLLARMEKKGAKVDIQRFKGLGEMMPKTLFETTLDPTRRILLQVAIPEEAALETERLVGDLMGKDVAARFDFIMHHASEVEGLDI